MFTLDVKADFGQTIKQLNELAAGIGDKVIVAALNETIQQAQTQVTRAIAADYNVKQSEVRDQLQIVRASRKGQRFEATLYGKKQGAKWSQNVTRFLVTKGQTRRARRAARLAKAFGARVSYDPLVQVRRAGSPVPIAGAFVLNVAGQPILRRVNGKLRGVQTVGVAQMFDRPSIQKPIIEWMPGKFAEIFERRMRYFVSTIK